MRVPQLIPLLLFALAACGTLPAPYQTYSPGQVPLPPPPPTALVVYGATTTSPEMAPDSSEVEPVPVPAASAASGGAKGQGVAICYNRLWNGPDQVKDSAVQACGGGNMSPRVTSQNIDLDACPLLTPTKAVFVCGPGAATP